ncbi:uncharacterized protein BX664DRAFT_321587 [Halteromyces radiatus]|uniref:uncharacterized protein n=1 Tax=Halteromyces radiatus TaxID=101107 RepID=UPI0022201806|nr:uncharacterized protein BX664DRAFT_321587 [Halteromyces radiatus]KAI8099553.1 hypothetical protein BX664DRAFT_321587 [Halteromyces radiatus]
MFAYLATFFTFGALVLEIFILLASTYNQPFLKSIYYVQFTLNDNFINFGLWGYCTGTIKTGVTFCSQPSAAFVWSTAPYIKTYTTGLTGMDTVYMANYILFWIAFGITLGALAITILDHFGRGVDFLASLATFLGFIVMLVTFIILVTISLKGINGAREANVNAYGHLGDCVWMHLGAMIGLLFGSLWYCFTCIFGGPRK